MVAVSEKILAIWGGIAAWAGRKIVDFGGRTYKTRFAAVKAFRQPESLYRRLIRRHLDSDLSNEFSFRGTVIFFPGVRKYHDLPVSQKPNLT